MNDLDKIKQIADNMPAGKEKTQALMAYNNLNAFEVLTDALQLSRLEITKVKNES